MKVVAIFLFAFLTATRAEARVTDGLLGVFMVFRHGDRTPLHSYPSDPYNGSPYLAGGRGQLTNAGKLRQYNFGKWLRNRYDGFLPAEYSNEDIFVASDDMDRTIMSAASNLAGLYPPVGDLVWNEDLLWQPIPIHPAELSIVSEMSTCPKIDVLHEEILKSEFFQSLLTDNKDLLDYLSNATGETIDSLELIDQVRDILYIEKTLNLTLPEWTDSVYPEKMNYLSGYAFSSFSEGVELAKLTSGGFIYKLLNTFDIIASNKTQSQKVFMYSGHDTNVVNILHAMLGDSFEPFVPNFAAALILELREVAGEVVINILLKDGGDEVQTFTLPGCTVDCPLEKAKTILAPVTLSPSQWEEECRTS